MIVGYNLETRRKERFLNISLLINKNYGGDEEEEGQSKRYLNKAFTLTNPQISCKLHS